MRPDQHKAKATKKWKAKHGITTTPSHPRKDSEKPSREAEYQDAAAPVPHNETDIEKPEARRKYSKQISPDHEKVGCKELKNHYFLKLARSKYARRKIESNAFRYQQPTAEEILAADEGIDRETEELRMLIREADEDYDPSLYFRFKEERDWNDSDADVGETDELSRGLLQLDFIALEKSLQRLPLHVRLSLNAEELTGASEGSEPSARNQPKPAHERDRVTDDATSAFGPDSITSTKGFPSATVASHVSRPAAVQYNKPVATPNSRPVSKQCSVEKAAPEYRRPAPVPQSVAEVTEKDTGLLTSKDIARPPDESERSHGVQTPSSNSGVHGTGQQQTDHVLLTASSPEPAAGDDELDFLLGLEPGKVAKPLTVTKPVTSVEHSTKTDVIPPAKSTSDGTAADDDLKWLDDILG